MGLKTRGIAWLRTLLAQLKRGNLTLNIIMLMHRVEAIKAWEMTG